MYLQKRSYSYYFRIAIPIKIQPFYGKREICFSLNTLNRIEARLKSLEYIQKYIAEFEQKKSLPVPSKQCELSSHPAPKSPCDTLNSFSFTAVYHKYLDERKPSANTVREFDTVVRRFAPYAGIRILSCM